jgi:hypothetical protein
MIFIAVTMGFFAESLRENITNKEKEKEYIGSLVNDLKLDSLYLATCIDNNKTKVQGLDSLLALSASDFSIPANRESVYKLCKYIAYYSNFSSNNATMMQLKNSGGLQYIKRDHVADSIALYDKYMEIIYRAEVPYTKAMDDANTVQEEILILTGKQYGVNRAFASDKFPFLTNDSRKIQLFFNKIYLVRGYTMNYIANMEYHLPNTVRLIELLQKEYNIDQSEK